MPQGDHLRADRWPGFLAIASYSSGQVSPLLHGDADSPLGKLLTRLASHWHERQVVSAGSHRCPADAFADKHYREIAEEAAVLDVYLEAAGRGLLLITDVKFVWLRHPSFSYSEPPIPHVDQFDQDPRERGLIPVGPEQRLYPREIAVLQAWALAVPGGRPLPRVASGARTAGQQIEGPSNSLAES